METLKWQPDDLVSRGILRRMRGTNVHRVALWRCRLDLSIGRNLIEDLIET